MILFKNIKHFCKNPSPLFNTIMKEYNINLNINESLKINPFDNIIQDSSKINFYEKIYQKLLNDPNDFKLFFEFLTKNKNNKIKFDTFILKRIYEQILLKNINNISNENKKLIFVFYKLFNYDFKNLNLFKNIKINNNNNLIDYFYKNKIDDELNQFINDDNINNYFNNKILINIFSKFYSKINKETITKYSFLKLKNDISIDELNLIIFLNKEKSINKYANFKYKYKIDWFKKYEIFFLIKLINKNFEFFEENELKLYFEKNINNINLENLNSENFFNLYYLSLKLNKNSINFYNFLKNFNDKIFKKDELNFDTAKLIIIILYKENINNINLAFNELKISKEILKLDNDEVNIQLLLLIKPIIKKKIYENKLNLAFTFKLTKLLYTFCYNEEIFSFFKSLEFSYAYNSLQNEKNNKIIKNFKLFLVIINFKKIGSRKIKSLLNLYLKDEKLEKRKKLYNEYIDVKKSLINIHYKEKIK